MNKSIIIPVLGLTFLTGLAILGVSAVKADEDSSYPSVLQRFTERFNLDEGEVDAFMNEMHEERQSQMQQQRETRLNDAVEAGVITNEQKVLVQEKWQELHQEKEQERQAHREEMQVWFEENGIDHDSLFGYMGQGGFGKRVFGKSIVK